MKIGTDIIEVERIENLSNVEKIFFESELDYANKSVLKYQHLAGFFAVKEAVIKAVEGGSINEIEVCHKENGAPYVILHGKTKELLKDRNIEISISHIKLYATAICVID